MIIIILTVVLLLLQQHQVSFKVIQCICCSSSRIYNSVCLDLNSSWGRGATTITFLSLRPLHFLSFYLQPKPRRSQMWRNVTLYDRWVCERVCVCVYIICLLLPICPRFCHIFLLYEHQQKKLVPTYRMAAPHQASQEKDTSSTCCPQWKFDRLAAKMHFAQGKLREELLQSIKSRLKSKEYIWIYCIHKDIIWAHSAFKTSKRNTYIVNLHSYDPRSTYNWTTTFTCSAPALSTTASRKHKQTNTLSPVLSSPAHDPRCHTQ